MRMGQDAMGGCVAHQSNKICELMIHGTSKCPQVLVPAIFGLLQPTSQRKRTIRAGLRAQCLLAPQPATWTQPVVSASAARPTSLAYPVTSVRQACSTAQASPATSRHNGKPKKLQCIRFRLEKPNSQLVALCVFLWIRAQTPIPLEKPNSQLVALCVFLWIRAQTPIPLEKPNSQLVALCVFLWIRAQTPIPLEKPNSQLVALCVFLWIRAPTPIPLEKPNSQLVALCVFLWIRAQTPIPLEKPKPKQLKKDHIAVVALCVSYHFL